MDDPEQQSRAAEIAGTLAVAALATRRKVSGLLDRVRVAGRTIKSVLTESRQNTASTLKRVFRDAVLAENDQATFSTQLDTAIRRRRRQILTTLRNIMTAVRGQARDVVVRTTRQNGAWHNVSVLDGNTTEICMQHIGLSWRLPYAQVPNKPPRIPPVHSCRSFLRWVPDTEDFTPEAPVIDQFNDDASLQADLLGPTKFEALQRGDIRIRGISDIIRIMSSTLEELGIR